MTIHQFNLTFQNSGGYSQLLRSVSDLRDCAEAREILRCEACLVGWEGWD